MKTPAIIFGTGSFAEVADFYLTHDSNYKVVAFTATDEAVKEDNLLGRPVVGFSDVVSHFSPDAHQMFVAIGYKKMNRVREVIMREASTLGYQLLTYMHSKVSYMGGGEIGKNVFIFEDNTIQPFTRIGDGTIMWSGNHFGHHSSIGECCFITSHVVISGHCKIGKNSFLGVNATVIDGVSIGSHCLIGANALIQKDTQDESVYVADKAKCISKTSDKFFL